jgi:hypothetical protein
MNRLSIMVIYRHGYRVCLKGIIPFLFNLKKKLICQPLNGEYWDVAG